MSVLLQGRIEPRKKRKGKRKKPGQTEEDGSNSVDVVIYPPEFEEVIEGIEKKRRYR